MYLLTVKLEDSNWFFHVKGERAGPRAHTRHRQDDSCHTCGCGLCALAPLRSRVPASGAVETSTLENARARCQHAHHVSAELRQTCTRLCTVVFSVLVSGVSQTTLLSDPGSVLAFVGTRAPGGV